MSQTQPVPSSAVWRAVFGVLILTLFTVPLFAQGLVINEVHADPDSGSDGDANGDGVRDSSDDEFVEIVNTGVSAVDLSGIKLRDSNTRHVFPDGTLVAAGCAVVVFGGGQPTGVFGGAVVQTASTGKLDLSSSGETLTLRDDDPTPTVIATLVYTGSSGDNQSHTRNPDLAVPPNLTLHSTAANDPKSLFSPGTRLDGTLFSGCTAPPTPPRLLLSEIGVTPDADEYIEIHNPNDTAVDLSDYYLTDATFDPGADFYYNIVTGLNAGGGGAGDFHARFPAGAMIGPGEFQTVAVAGSGNFSAAWGATPDYELFEDGGAPDAVSDLRAALPGSIDASSDLADDGEVVILYYWDGASDRVVDIDIALWGDKAEAVDKTGVVIDGPDAGSVGSAFQDDTPVATQGVIAGGAHGAGEAFRRLDVFEGAEIQVNGNGTAGSDETSENLSATWRSDPATPGTETLGPVVINEFLSDPKDSAAGDANGDGVTSNLDDRFIELVNDTDGPFDLSGFSLFDEVELRHTFPAGTVLEAGCPIVVFSGGMPEGYFGDAVVQTASTTSLSLSRQGDIIRLRDPAGVTFAFITFDDPGTEFDQSFTRDPDLASGGFVGHTTVAAALGALFSPGVATDGSLLCDASIFSDDFETGTTDRWSLIIP